ncbi:sulfite exporter TauE/SafE family protein [Foetidibacter luteolus]|uniref:sulfite exporter TauE/SafE family protein n=1 Tax=Foetidibacter luteolus TaxID=2608880 RepID=UPI00129BCFE5|nr:sulfite exporter TauE/SafE family protein [Foetidibacter luteolus]
MEHLEIVFFFLVIAFVYSSVGLGGGSSYLAILALYHLPFAEMRLTALLCNIIVVTGGTIVFIKNKQVNWRKIIPLVAVSIPLAYAGASLKISQDTFFIVLGFSLLVAGALLWLKTKNAIVGANGNNANYVRDGLLGGAIGFLSGMVGIGGGIFLSPLLNLSRWDVPKRIAATASVFILVNSVAGIAGQLKNLPAEINYTRILLLCLAVLAGGQIGSRMAALKFNQLAVKRITAVVVFAAGVEVLWKHW